MLTCTCWFDNNAFVVDVQAHGLGEASSIAAELLASNTYATHHCLLAPADLWIIVP